MRIEADGISKSFGHVAALRGVSFSIEPGSRVALVGANGSGKSTLNRVLAGLLAFDGGLRMGGCDQRAERAAISAQMVYLPQTAPLSNVPVREVVGAFARLRGLSVSELEKAGQRLEIDVQRTAAASFRSLSGGMRQKLLLSLALACPATLFLLDEPTASLDVRTRERFFEMFSSLSRSATMIFCSHRLEEIRALVDEVLALEDGQISYRGPAPSFLDVRARSILEICVAEGADAVLFEHGFRRAAGGWWVRGVSRTDKGRILEALLPALGPRVRDLNVRELEGLDLCAEDPPEEELHA